MTRRCKRIEAQRHRYSYSYLMADFEACEKITANAKRVERIAKIMRDPFFLQAERAGKTRT